MTTEKRKLNIAQFAAELGLSVALLLEQLKVAGIHKEHESDTVSENDKTLLLVHLCQPHGVVKTPIKITLTRHSTTALEKQVATLKQEVAMLKREKASVRKPGKTREQVQEDLIHATFLCLKYSGGTTQLQNIFDTINTDAHRRRIIKWVETYAPVSVRNSKIFLNKSSCIWKDRDFILSNFDEHIEKSGMINDKWYSIAEKTTKQKFWVSIVSGGGGPGTGKKR